MELHPSNWRYNISQIAEITGLSKQVIRKWEERYQLIQPMRLDNGHRVYNDRDLQLILKALDLSRQGYPIKQAVMMVQEDKDKEKEELPSVPDMGTIDDSQDFISLLLKSGTQCDEVELNRLLQQANYTIGLSKFLSHIVIPFLQEVGARWERKEWTEYQESVSSMAVRDYLVQLRRNYHHKKDAPLIMGACLPGEYHEVPLHILLLQAMMQGWKSFLVGGSPAVGAIESLIIKFQPKVVLLSAMTNIPFELYPNILEQLDQFASKQPAIRFFIGGAGGIEQQLRHPCRFIKGANTIEEVFQCLNED